MVVESSLGTEARWTGGAADGPAGVRLRAERPNQRDALMVMSAASGFRGGGGGSGLGGVRVADEVGDGVETAGASMGLAQRGHDGVTGLGFVFGGVGEKRSRTINLLSRICTLTPVSPSMMDQLPVKSDPLGGYSYWGVFKSTFNNNWSRVRNGSRYKLTCPYDCDELINCHEGKCPDPLNATVRLQEEVEAPKGSCPVCASETMIQSWKGKGRLGPGYAPDGEYAQPYGSIVN